MHNRVHRRLHPKAAALTDQELVELGKLSFHEQFPVMEQLEAMGPAPDAPAVVLPTSAFGGLSREEFMERRIHRRLHAQAAHLGDQRLSEIGQLSFNEQFPLLEHTGPLGGATREEYMERRVHRRLHAHATLLSDQQLSELGRLSFNQQFTVLESMPTAAVPTSDLFGGLSREAYMQQRVHRRLHDRAAALSDEELHELGKLSFNEQFPMLGAGDPVAEAAIARDSSADLFAGLTEAVVEANAPEADLFGGLSREAYMAQRVHRKLHAQAASLDDAQLLELGRLSFNQQFPLMERNATEAERTFTDLFSGVGREAYMQNRVHRRLHSKAAVLSDKELLDLGKLSFNEQFPALEGIEVGAG
mmetsp:Transcript_35371/g.110280  ORF Transcript_35371/g.110280 Transcript_35371/m.110280 type:complete len:360 (+) Transcript_35371:56-1135(+)